MLHIRKTLLVRDIVTSEMGHIVDPPTVRAVALAVMGNPFSSSTVAPVYGVAHELERSSERQNS
jgi:hypothetical protein